MAELIAETATNYFAEIDENSKTNEQLSDARTTTISNLIKENRFLSIEYSFLLEDREVDEPLLLIFQAFLLVKIEFC